MDSAGVGTYLCKIAGSVAATLRVEDAVVGALPGVLDGVEMVHKRSPSEETRVATCCRGPGSRNVTSFGMSWSTLRCFCL